MPHAETGRGGAGAIEPRAGEAQPALGLPRPSFRSDIEGLRAVAIVMVAGYHAGLPGFSGGYVGVDVFFVVSGYLITWLLVYEVETKGKVDLPRFYARRARRLLPALAVVLVITMLAAGLILAPFEQKEWSLAALSTAGYFSNLYFAKAATDYHGPEAATNPLLHTWSLSVEEQFYVVWPLFVMAALRVLLSRRGRRGDRITRWMLVVTVLSFSVSAWLTGVRQPWAFFLSATRAWEFSIGALALLIPQRSRPGFTSPAAGWLGLAGIVLAGVLFDKHTSFPGVAALLPVVGTALVLRAGSERRRDSLGRLLGRRPLQEIGRLSYSWYLWHWPVLVLAVALYDGLEAVHMVGLLLLALILAEASYRLAEDPIRRSSWLSFRPRRSLAMGASLTVAGMGLALLWHHGASEWSDLRSQEIFSQARNDIPIIYDQGCDRWFYNADVVECEFGNDGAVRTAVLFGDSHAGQWFSAIEPLAGKAWKLIVITKSACPIVDAPLYYARIGRFYTECEQWRADAIRRIAEISPDLTIVSYDDQYGFSAPQWQEGTASAFRSLSTSSREVLIIRDTPQPRYDLPRCLARAAWRPSILNRTECWIQPKVSSDADRAQRLAAADLRNVRVLDMGPHICTEKSCPPIRGDVVTFRDGGHMTDSFAASLSSLLLEQILWSVPGERSPVRTTEVQS